MDPFWGSVDSPIWLYSTMYHLESGWPFFARNLTRSRQRCSYILSRFCEGAAMAAQMAKQVTWVMAIDRCMIEVRSKRWLCHRRQKLIDCTIIQGTGSQAMKYILLGETSILPTIGTTGSLDLVLLGNVKLGRSWPWAVHAGEGPRWSHAKS